jgi:UDP:flavonoid glycosyltransferase YjiC (YdhE family)
MKIVFAAIPAYVHLYPLMPLAEACADAGHEVTVAAGPPFVDRLRVPTAHQQPADADLSATFTETKRRHPGSEGFDLAMAMFADVMTEMVTNTLLPLLEQTSPDLVVYEAMNAGAGVVADLLHIPALAYAITLTHVGYATVHPAAIAYRRGTWLGRGLTPPSGSPLLARGLLSPVPPTLQAVTGSPDVPRMPIRPVPYAEDLGVVPAWLQARKTRPRIYLTLGTVSFGAVEVLRRAVAETSELEVDVLVAVGPEGDPAALGDVSDNVHIERFVNQAQVLPLVDLAVTHGGTGTVLGALQAGLPQLLIPQGGTRNRPPALSRLPPLHC